MSNYVERKIDEIQDPAFQTLVAELCQCVNWSEDEFKNKTLANLFTTIVIEGKILNLEKILNAKILNKKVKHFTSGSVVQGICCELANRKGKAMDDFAEKSVFTLIKQCYKAVCPRKKRAQTPSKLQQKHRSQTSLILCRRENGSYS